MEVKEGFIMPHFDFNQTKTKTGFKRTLMLDGNPIAVVYIDTDEAVPVFTAYWRLNNHVSLEQMVDHWLSVVLPDNGWDRLHESIVIEFWVSEEFKEAQLIPPVRMNSILEAVNKANNAIDHLLLNGDRRVIELTFEKNEPICCFCTLENVKLPSFASFFYQYHENDEVRSGKDAILEAFDPSRLKLFDPIPAQM